MPVHFSAPTVVELMIAVYAVCWLITKFATALEPPGPGSGYWTRVFYRMFLEIAGVAAHYEATHPAPQFLQILAPTTANSSAQVQEVSSSVTAQVVSPSTTEGKSSQ